MLFFQIQVAKAQTDFVGPNKELVKSIQSAPGFIALSLFDEEAVLLKSGMGNLFKGQIGGLAVYDKALSEKKLKELAGL